MQTLLYPPAGLPVILKDLPLRFLISNILEIKEYTVKKFGRPKNIDTSKLLKSI